MERAGRPACANDRAKGRRALPFSYEIDTKIGVAKLSGQGIVTDEDLSRLVDDIWSDPDWRIDLPTLTDFSAAIALEFTPDGIRRVFELLSSKRDGLSRDGIKSAVVVTKRARNTSPRWARPWPAACRTCRIFRYSQASRKPGTGWNCRASQPAVEGNQGFAA